MAALKKEDPIVIVGGGVFGLSTAFHLLKKGYQNVTVLERAREVPARDSAGYDLNKSAFQGSLSQGRVDSRKDVHRPFAPCPGGQLVVEARSSVFVPPRSRSIIIFGPILHEACALSHQEVET